MLSNSVGKYSCFVLGVTTLRHLREQVASFFEPSVTGIIGCIEDYCSHSCIPTKVFTITWCHPVINFMLQAICLVGSFSMSDYLFSRLDEHFSVRDVSVMRPDGYLYVIC